MFRDKSSSNSLASRWAANILMRQGGERQMTSRDSINRHDMIIKSSFNRIALL